MSWLRIDDGFPEHEKVFGLSGPGVKWLHVVALCQCAKNLTDGVLDAQRVKVVCAIANVPRPGHAIHQLVAAGLWLELEEGGYEIKDYLDYNPDAATVKEIRDARKEAGRQGGLKSGKTRRGEANAVADVEANASPKPEAKGGSNSSSRGVEPRPVPSLKQEPLAAAAPPRKRDELWEALLDVCGIDQGSLTRTGRGATNKALMEIRETGATVTEVRGRAAEFRRRYPQISLTPSALAKHWGSLRPAETVREDKYAHLMEVDVA